MGKALAMMFMAVDGVAEKWRPNWSFRR